MTRRARHPLKTLLLLVAFAGAAALVWEHREKFSIDREVEKPDAKVIARIAEAVEEKFKDDPCLLGIQGPLLWRANENRYRMNIDIDPVCAGTAKDICQRMARFIKEQGEYPASVFAYNGAGDELGKYID